MRMLDRIAVVLGAGIAGFAGGVAGQFMQGGALTYAQTTTPAPALTATRLDIVDAGGAARISFYMDAQGEPTMAMTDAQGGEFWAQRSDTAWMSKHFIENVEIVKTPEGLQYQVTQAGSGDAAATPADTVSVHYRGWLVNGKEFDSSYKRGEPASFALNGVIKGWTLGVSGMKVGEKRRLFIPAELGYGEAGAGGVIPPNAMLIFDVELVKIGK